MKYFIDGNNDLVESTLYKRTDYESFLEWLEDKQELALDTETEGLR